MMDAAASLGMMIGPIMGGSLKELIGYEWMNWTWGKKIDFYIVCH